MRAQSELKPTAALLAATAVWGATFVTVKDALTASDSFTFLALRFAVGALTAALLAAILRKTSRLPAQSDSKGTWVTGLGLGVLLFAGYAMQTVGLETTTAARSAFITGLTVIFVPFVSWWLNGKRPPTRAFVAPLVALVGLQRMTGVTFCAALPVGDALTLGCAVVYAFHIVGMGKWGKSLPALELTAVQLAVVSILSAGCLPFIERRFEPTAGYWSAVIFTGVVASALAIAVQVWAQAKLSSVRAAVIFSIEPVFALAWALVVGRGWPSAAELVGGGFLIAAVLVSEFEWPLQKRRAAPSPG